MEIKAGIFDDRPSENAKHKGVVLDSTSQAKGQIGDMAYANFYQINVFEARRAAA